MNMIVYRPETEKDKKELEKRAAVIHNQEVLLYVRQLSCPDYQKQALVKAILTELPSS
ncbi:MAG: hypothetical protein QM657_12625 [Lacrimispora sp.]|uniref:hypothetical protein n=1 Tax=Lacrimispora sp. TaxID=2719234 RepID=UPI0039E25D90